MIKKRSGLLVSGKAYIGRKKFSTFVPYLAPEFATPFFPALVELVNHVLLLDLRGVRRRADLACSD